MRRQSTSGLTSVLHGLRQGSSDLGRPRQAPCLPGDAGSKVTLKYTILEKLWAPSQTARHCKLNGVFRPDCRRQKRLNPPSAQIPSTLKPFVDAIVASFVTEAAKTADLIFSEPAEIASVPGGSR